MRVPLQPTIQPFSLLDYYLTSVGIGLRSLPSRYLREALARILNPLSYHRYMEYELILDQLELTDGCRVLDIGSPKLPTLLLARNAQCELYSTDLRDNFIGSTAHFLKLSGFGQRLGADLHLETQDARHLSYPDDSFDRVFSISVIEHIPEDGDTHAMREIARVLRPGGVLTLTVPFAAEWYEEEWVRGGVYERQDGGPTFYQRRYDLAELHRRLIEPSGLRLVEATYFGEPGMRFEPFWNRIPLRWKIPLLWAQPFIARLLLRRLRADQIEAACGVALKLEKGPRAVALR